CIEFTDSSPAVSAHAQVPGRVAFDYCYINNSGIWVNNRPNSNLVGGTDFRFNAFMAESFFTPFLKIGPMGVTSDFNLTDVVDADQLTGSGTPIVEATGSSVQGVSITGGQVSGGQPPMLISSYGLTALYVNHSPSPNLGNTQWTNLGVFASEVNNQPFSA